MKLSLPVKHICMFWKIDFESRNWNLGWPCVDCYSARAMLLKTKVVLRMLAIPQAVLRESEPRVSDYSLHF